MSGLPFAALVLYLCITTGEFTILVEFSQINVSVGGGALFSVRPSAVISSGSWIFKGKTIAQWIRHTASFHNAYTLRGVLFTSNGSFLLKSVKMSDTGEYRVNMVPASGTQFSAVVTLRVFAKRDDNCTPGSGAIVGIVLGLLGMGLIGGVSGWLIARKTGGSEGGSEAAIKKMDEYLVTIYILSSGIEQEQCIAGDPHQPLKSFPCAAALNQKKLSNQPSYFSIEHFTPRTPQASSC
ncbi:uncharacterized protein [Mobula birostris]|uniref:uncharacterized protein isoform X2 n=1 Tax=Mobula birostris TaxID=1983395 RepID=UPI003B27F5FD